jgi:hypothetical protein
MAIHSDKEVRRIANWIDRAWVCVCVCVWERESVCVCVWEREWVMSKYYLRTPLNEMRCLLKTILSEFSKQRNILRMQSSGMWPRVGLLRTDVSDECVASWIWRRHVLPKRRFSQEPHGATSQKTEFFIVTAAKASNPTQQNKSLLEWPLVTLCVFIMERVASA